MSEFNRAVDRAADLLLRALRVSADAHDETVAGRALTAVVRVCSSRRDGLFSPADVDAALAAVVAATRNKFEAHIFRQASPVPSELRVAVVSHFSRILDESLSEVVEQLPHLTINKWLATLGRQLEAMDPAIPTDRLEIERIAKEIDCIAAKLQGAA